jgi:hypothetical protein
LSSVTAILPSSKTVFEPNIRITLNSIQHPFHCMKRKSANNGNRQNTISIVTRLQVVKPTETGLTPRKGTRSLSCTKHANTIRSPYSLLFYGCWEWRTGCWNWQNFLPPNEGRAVYTAIPSTFCTGRVLHSLVVHKKAAGVVIRGYSKYRNLCVILDLQMTLHSAASRIYQVLVLIITLINTNQ